MAVLENDYSLKNKKYSSKEHKISLFNKIKSKYEKSRDLINVTIHYYIV